MINKNINGDSDNYSNINNITSSNTQNDVNINDKSSETLASNFLKS